jgi:Protein of unknown function (DUF664)
VVDVEFERETLVRYFTRSFDDLVGKIDGLGEYDVRRPLVPSGTNLLGLVQHSGAVVLEYATLPWGRERGRELMWEDTDDEPDIDLRVLPGVTRDDVLRLAADARAAMLELLEGPLHAPGEVPWWGPNKDVTVHRVAVHVIGELARHAGHADILREYVDGSAGMRVGDPNVVERDLAHLEERFSRIEADAKRFQDGTMTAP